MRNTEEIHTRERADRALREGRSREALGHYWQLLGSVKAERVHYERWLDGAVGAYLALNRTREAGYILLSLRRYSEAQRHFPAAERPLEWALCAAKLGHHSEAARVLSESGHRVLAAIELESAGAMAAARLEWERVLRDPRLGGRPYETALVHFNLGEALLQIGDRPGAMRAFVDAQRLLETAADGYETRGERQRAIECYGVLLRIGKDTASFENVAEGYLNAIRVLATDNHSLLMQYYDDFLAYAVDRGEWHAAATVAREAADSSLRTGKKYAPFYLERAVEAWTRAARENQANDGPVDLSANALHAAIDASTALGDLEACGRLYAEMAELPVGEKRRLRYRTLAQRYAAMPAEPRQPTVGLPEYLRRADSSAYPDVWRQDLVEWELGGDPSAVLVRYVANNPPTNQYLRQGLRALLICNDPGFSREKVQEVALLISALGGVRHYDVLSPLERLFDHPAPEVRGAVMGAVTLVYTTRIFGLIRRGLADPAPSVANEALSALRNVKFVDALDPAMRIFRESVDERVRLAVLEGIGRIGTPEAALGLIEAVRQETGAVRAAAETQLARLKGDDEIAALIRQARDAEIGDRREILDRVIKAIR
ncbi:MAG TPA: HEAT repeat domain-containing protein [Polyangia bacterium]|jgi:tetratricopeptide (TPR) repeat protein|nr:HEAT repeat domain-containing protein [Polyangia bacterium]